MPKTAQHKQRKSEGDMAARLRKMHTDEIRTKIQTSQLINRLTNHALGELELTSTQVRAIEVLLKKTIPDLQAVDFTGQMEHLLTKEADQWLGLQPHE